MAQTFMTKSSENPDEYSSYSQEDFLQVQRVEQVSTLSCTYEIVFRNSF